MTLEEYRKLVLALGDECDQRDEEMKVSPCEGKEEAREARFRSMLVSHMAIMALLHATSMEDVMAAVEAGLQDSNSLRAEAWRELQKRIHGSTNP